MGHIWANKSEFYHIVYSFTCILHNTSKYKVYLFIMKRTKKYLWWRTKMLFVNCSSITVPWFIKLFGLICYLGVFCLFRIYMAFVYCNRVTFNIRCPSIFNICRRESYYIFIDITTSCLIIRQTTKVLKSTSSIALAKVLTGLLPISYYIMC